MEKREIKFRAWDGKRMWTDPFMFEPTNNGKYACCTDVMRDSWFTAEHLMQYTGLKDKNGKEIYEGDLVLHDSGSIPSHKIVYSVDGFKMKRLTTNQLLPLRSHYKGIEVIGNIYENPELLTN